MSPRRSPRPTLPKDLDGLRGLRAARWTRESTGRSNGANKPTGYQWDSFGPEAQREQQDRAIERYGLVDVTAFDPTLDFGVAHSGRTLDAAPTLNTMLQRAGLDFDVLVLAYVSRFARNLRTSVNTRHDLHERGVAMLFADEDILTSDERKWREWADEAVEAEAYSRKMGRRIREGYEAKRRRLGEPGGRPPFGFLREGRPPVLVVDPERLATLTTMFELSAGGLTDSEVAGRLGLKKSHVAEVLTNRFYIGEVRDGKREPVIDPGLWEQVQANRHRHTRRHPGPVSYRQYLWSGLLVCRSCGRRLIGHCGRYRHTEACEAFRAARPDGIRDGRGKGDSYVVDAYDGVAPRALRHVAANAELVADVAVALNSTNSGVDVLTVARIERERAQATRRLEGDRDVVAWQQTMARLDRDEAQARASAQPPSAVDVATHLADMLRLYGGAAPETQRRIVQALFERVEVLGPNEVWLVPSEEAIARGWAAAMSGEFRVELRQSGRGERI